MKLSRRSFNRLALLNTMAFGVNAFGRSKVKSNSQHQALSILQGATDESSAQFSIVAQKEMALEFFVVEGPSGDILEPNEIRVEKQDFSDWSVTKLYFTDLNLDFSYDLICQQQNGNIIDQRKFKLLDPLRSDLKLGVVSCMMDHFHRESMWKALRKESPELLFFIGDSVYADMPSVITSINANLEQYWKRFVEARNKLAFYRFQELIPVIAVWDDHDYGKNNSDRTFPYKNETRYGFETFMAQDRPCSYLQRGPGISSHIQAFNQDFFLLDGRFFRSERGAHDETLFGEIQEQWFFNRIDPTRPTWIISGSQWFGAYARGEAYEETHPNSFRRFLSRLKSKLGKFIFVSGDVHYSEIMKIEPEHVGHETLELTSSSIHSIIFNGMYNPGNNPRRLSSTSNRNFFILDLASDGEVLSLNVKCVEKKNIPAFSYKFEMFSQEEELEIRRVS